MERMFLEEEEGVEATLKNKTSTVVNEWRECR